MGFLIFALLSAFLIRASFAEALFYLGLIGLASYANSLS